MKKFYFINYIIDLGASTPYYGQELIDITPLEYIVYHKKLGGDYQNRCILYAQEITEVEYKEYTDFINEE